MIDSGLELAPLRKAPTPSLAESTVLFATQDPDTKNRSFYCFGPTTLACGKVLQTSTATPSGPGPGDGKSADHSDECPANLPVPFGELKWKNLPCPTEPPARLWASSWLGKLDCSAAAAAESSSRGGGGRGSTTVSTAGPKNSPVLRDCLFVYGGKEADLARAGRPGPDGKPRMKPSNKMYCCDLEKANWYSVELIGDIYAVTK